MAAPITFTEELSDIFATTLRNIQPTVADTFFTSRAFFLRLYQQRRVVKTGGREIQQNILVDAPPGGSYKRGARLDISKKNILAALRFPWAYYYSAITEDGADLVENAGPQAVMNLARIRLEAARQRIEDDVATHIFLDGTGNDGADLIGLRAAVDNGDTVPSYGGITRGSTGPGSRIKGNVNTTGGQFSLDIATSAMVSASLPPHKPDLIVTTPTLWGAFHDRIQPAQRFLTERGEQIARAGFDVFSWMGADVIYDNKCPEGTMWFLNTSTLTFYVHKARLFALDGPRVPANVDQRTTRMWLVCQLVCDNPRLNALYTGLTA